MSLIDFFHGILLGSPDKGSWSHVPSMRMHRHGCAAATLNDDTLVIIGGHNGVSESDCVHVYKDGVWTTGTSMKTRRLGSVAATMKTSDGSSGGWSRRSSLAQC